MNQEILNKKLKNLFESVIDVGDIHNIEIVKINSHKEHTCSCAYNVHCHVSTTMGTFFANIPYIEGAGEEVTFSFDEMVMQAIDNNSVELCRNLYPQLHAEIELKKIKLAAMETILGLDNKPEIVVEFVNKPEITEDVHPVNSPEPVLQSGQDQEVKGKRGRKKAEVKPSSESFAEAAKLLQTVEASSSPSQQG